MTTGPMQLVVAGFNGDVMESTVIDELYLAGRSGSIQLIDMLIVEKDAEGQVWAAEVSDLTEEDEIRYGALIGGLIGLGAGGEEGAIEGAVDGIAEVAATHSVLGLTPLDVNELVYSLPGGHSAVVVLFEHVWARELHEAVLGAGGVVIGQALIEPEGLVLLGAEMAAAIEAAAVIEATHQIEEEAMAEAAAVVMLSETIEEEAINRAVAALVTAEIVEEAAREHAAEVVKAAYAEGGEEG